MRLEIDGGGYETAARAYAEGNQLAALCHDRLAGRLAGRAGMAGDDSTSQEFAAAYDEAAREALASLADLVDACAGLGHLTHASVRNHVYANLRSIMGGATVYDGGLLPDVGDDFGYVTVLPATPPTALGATGSSLPDGVSWILDHIEGFVWPGADVARLRAAAQAWRDAANGLDDLLSCCDSAVRGFWGERSPEIPLAIDATHDLRSSVRDLAAQYVGLASACDRYADDVEAKRAEVIELAEWLLEQIVEGILISVAIGAITAGAGAAAGGSAVVARVVAETPGFLRILEALRTLAASTAASVRAAREAVLATRASLVKFKDAAVARSIVQGERGTFKMWWERNGVRLRDHEHSGSHTIAKHVGRTLAQLKARLADERHLRRASTFPDERTAEWAINKTLEANSDKIRIWMESAKFKENFTADVGDEVGQILVRSTQEVISSCRVRLALVKDPRMPDGWRLLTAFPD